MNACVCLEWFGKAAGEMTLQLSTHKSRTSQVVKTGQGLPGRGNNMSKAQKQETAESIRETSGN